MLVDGTPTGYGGPVSTPRRYQRLAPAERRDQILDAANELFAERGYDAVTIEDVARSAGVARGLVHHYFGGRTEVYVALVERLGALREDELRAPEGRNARERVADSVSRWLDWTEANRAIYLGTIAPGEDIADPDVRRVVTELVHRAIALVATFHSEIAEDSPRLRYALECWTGLNRAATRRWLRGDATRKATHELLASTLEHVLRTFGSAPDRRTARPDRSFLTQIPCRRAGVGSWPRWRTSVPVSEQLGRLPPSRWCERALPPSWSTPPRSYGRSGSPPPLFWAPSVVRPRVVHRLSCSMGSPPSVGRLGVATSVVRSTTEAAHVARGAAGG